MNHRYKYRYTKLKIELHLKLKKDIALNFYYLRKLNYLEVLKIK